MRRYWPNADCDHAKRRPERLIMRHYKKATAGEKLTVTAENLRKTFDYYPETGDVIWKTSTRKNFKRVGEKIKYNLKPRAYRRIEIGDIRIQIHQAIWCWMTGEWPTKQLDHINRNKHDNRWCNLRECEQQENLINRERSRTSWRSVYRGVRYASGKYYVQLFNKKHRLYVGGFESAVYAAVEYDKAAILIHGNFAVLNFPKLRGWYLSEESAA